MICASVLGKVKDFLGIMAKANEKLELSQVSFSLLEIFDYFSVLFHLAIDVWSAPLQKNSHADYDIEVLSGNEKEYIEMVNELVCQLKHNSEIVQAFLGLLTDDGCNIFAGFAFGCCWPP